MARGVERLPLRGGVHGRRGQELEQVIDHDVAQRAHGVVEAPAVLDPELLGERDLHARHVVAVPHGVEHPVGEAQVQQLLEADLAEEVVHPEDLRLADRAVQLGGQRLRRGEVVPERLLHQDPGALGQPRRGQAPDHPAEQRRRRLQVEDRLLRSLDRRGDPPVGAGIVEVALDVGQAPREPFEHRAFDPLTAGPDRLAHVPAQRGGRPVVHRDAHDRALQHPAALQPVQRPIRHLLREVSGEPEDHEHVRGVGAHARTLARREEG